MIGVGPSDELVKWWNSLREKGLVPDGVLRVLIDVDWTGKQPVKVFYECYADEKMFSVALIEVLSGVEIKRLSGCLEKAEEDTRIAPKEPQNVHHEEYNIGVNCWHPHYDDLLELLPVSWADHVTHIKGNRTNEGDPFCATYELRADEIELHLKRIKMVRGKLPAEVVRATNACHKAKETLGKAYDACIKADKAAEDADDVHEDASEAYEEAQSKYYELVTHKHLAAIESLHAEECPDCSWDGETLFPNRKEPQDESKS